MKLVEVKFNVSGQNEEGLPIINVFYLNEVNESILKSEGINIHNKQTIFFVKTFGYLITKNDHDKYYRYVDLDFDNKNDLKFGRVIDEVRIKIRENKILSILY